MSTYERNPDEIYRQSFEIIRRETDLSRIPKNVEPIVVRMIHAVGMIDLVDDIVFSDGISEALISAIANSKPILADANMVANGITKRFLTDPEQVKCLLDDPRIAPLAQKLSTTRSAAQITMWRPHLDGAIVVIGNAPTALFHLLERLQHGWPRPAAIIGCPVGFVGARESKEALIKLGDLCPFITVRGRRGGSAIASSVINAAALLARGETQGG